MCVPSFWITLGFSGRLAAMLNNSFGGGNLEVVRVDIGGGNASIIEMQLDIKHSAFNDSFSVRSFN